MRQFKVENELGEKRFSREEDAYDYAIMVLTQCGVRSEISKVIKERTVDIRAELEKAIAKSQATDYEKGNILYLAEQRERLNKIKEE